MADDTDALVKAKQRAIARALAREQAETRERHALGRIRKLERELDTRQTFLLGKIRDVELSSDEALVLAGILSRVADKPKDWAKIKKWTAPGPASAVSESADFVPTRPKVAAGG